MIPYSKFALAKQQFEASNKAASKMEYNFQGSFILELEITV